MIFVWKSQSWVIAMLSVAGMLLLSACVTAQTITKIPEKPLPSHKAISNLTINTPTAHSTIFETPSPSTQQAIPVSSSIYNLSAVAFPTQEIGWVLAIDPACQVQAGIQVDCTAIYKTGDGGQTWYAQTHMPELLTDLFFS